MLADREQLLAAAERAIARYGPDLTMDEIAAEATVTKPILYRTIGDRAALVTALSEAMIDRITAAIGETLTGETEPVDQFGAAVPWVSSQPSTWTATFSRSSTLVASPPTNCDVRAGARRND